MSVDPGHKITDRREQTEFRQPRQPHPGNYIRGLFEDYNLSIADAARRLHMDRASLSNVIHAKSALSSDLALKIEALTGHDAEVLIAMQANYERDHIRPERKARYFREIERVPQAELA